jgi:hypothetical protein
MMPDLAVTGIEPLLLWAAVGLFVLLLVISCLAVGRSGSFGPVAALFGIPALGVITWSVFTFADHWVLRHSAMEREALNARALQLTAAAMIPGSPLACLDAGAGDAVETSCEAAIFLKPETVAAATAYVEARLQILADSLQHPRRGDDASSDELAHLQRGIEADPYGFVAYLLTTRHGCTADACSIFALLRDADAVRANINARTLENKIARHAPNWPPQKSPPIAAVSGHEPQQTGSFSASGTKPIDFPSAASIPPVSIMTDPVAPPAAEAAQSNGAPTPPVRRPPANAGGTARAAPVPASGAARPQ